MRGQQRRASRSGADGGQDGGSHGAELLGRRLGAAVPAPGVSNRHGNGRRPAPAPGGREGRREARRPGTCLPPARVPAGFFPPPPPGSGGAAAAEGRARLCRPEAGPVLGEGPAAAAVVGRGWEATAVGPAAGPGGAARSPARSPRGAASPRSVATLPRGAAGRAAALSEGVVPSREPPGPGRNGRHFLETVFKTAVEVLSYTSLTHNVWIFFPRNLYCRLMPNFLVLP